MIHEDYEIKRKSIKRVVQCLKKKFSDGVHGSERVVTWISKMESILEEPKFDVSTLKECSNMRKELNDIIERTLNADTRLKLRSSWFSLGKSLEKKIKPK